MNTHFLTDIEINAFKCFTDFKASGFKRVNLIGGKNNIGKTAFMEACFVNVHAIDVNSMITAIISIKYNREAINLRNKNFDSKMLFDIASNYLDAAKVYKTRSNLSNNEFFVNVKDAAKYYQFNINSEDKILNANNIDVILRSIDNVLFVHNFGWSDLELNKVFEAIQKNEQENELNAFVKAFDDSIENFKVIGDKPQCKTHGVYRDITEFGDGLRHYISIICALYAAENGYLFVDEIDNGIHYSQLDRLWELILTLSKKTNCQVFATTHSKEMLESFARVSQKLHEQDISYTTLVKDKKGTLKR
ncbi:MAG: AAA family ATPase [Methylococcales bacterium]|nr:AAA family ATPase [Methylococcales bacterium]